MKFDIKKPRGSKIVMKVKDAASAYPFVLGEDDSVAKAIEIVRRKKLCRIPVVDGKRKLVGIVTRFDLLVGFMAKPLVSHGGAKGGWRQMPDMPKANPPKASSVSVGNVMRKAVETVAPGAVLQAALRKMTDTNISDLIVVEDGVPVGVLATRDLLKLVVK